MVGWLCHRYHCLIIWFTFEMIRAAQTESVLNHRCSALKTQFSEEQYCASAPIFSETMLNSGAKYMSEQRWFRDVKRSAALKRRCYFPDTVVQRWKLLNPGNCSAQRRFALGFPMLEKYLKKYQTFAVKKLLW